LKTSIKNLDVFKVSKELKDSNHEPLTELLYWVSEVLSTPLDKPIKMVYTDTNILDRDMTHGKKEDRKLRQ
jgi:hypothetical protein